MANNRIFWACQAILQATHGEADMTNATALYGVQSVGITTTFNLEQAFELGQIGLYENIEEVPDVEVTIEKVLDGRPLIYTSMCPTAGSIVAKANDRRDVYLAIYSDTAEKAGAAEPGSIVYCSGMYVSSLTYTLPVDGNSTESVTMVGNDKRWYGNASDFTTVLPAHLGAKDLSFGAIGSEHSPGSDGVQRRENVNLAASVLPADIPGVEDTSTGNGWDSSANSPHVHLNSITVSADLGRDAINELGRKTPYHRYVTFPLEVTSEFEVTTVSGDLVDARSTADNLTDRQIYIAMTDGTILDLASKNKLNSVTYAGGSTGGENATVTYSYSTFNALTITSPS